MRQSLNSETFLVEAWTLTSVRRQWKIKRHWALTRHVPNTNIIVILTQSISCVVFAVKSVSWCDKSRHTTPKCLITDMLSDKYIYIYYILYYILYCLYYYYNQNRPLSGWETILKQHRLFTLEVDIFYYFGVLHQWPPKHKNRLAIHGNG